MYFAASAIRLILVDIVRFIGFASILWLYWVLTKHGKTHPRHGFIASNSSQTHSAMGAMGYFFGN